MHKNYNIKNQKLHGSRRKASVVAVFFFVSCLFCVVFTDIELKKKGQNYTQMWQKGTKGAISSGMCMVLEELMPVYDFLGDGEKGGGIFEKIYEMVVPYQLFLAKEQGGNGAHWKQAISADSEVVVDYDHMMYKENQTYGGEDTEDGTEKELPEQEIVEEDGGMTGEISCGSSAAGLSYEEDAILSENEVAKQLLLNEKQIQTLRKKKNYSYLLSNFYIVDGTTKAVKSVFQPKKLLEKNMSMKKAKKANKPQIMIYHTHASEAFIDSRNGNSEDTVVGVGDILTQELQEYGYQVYHDTTKYDIVNGSLDRNKAYNQAAEGIQHALETYPSIEVIIDLHRDSGKKRVTYINGKKTAQIMLFNGLSRTRKGAIGYLKNDNLQANLAFSLQVKIAAMSLYADFAKPIYLKGYRYNLHYREKSLLIELGTDHNTVEEAKNAMEPLACVLDKVLSKN